MLARSVTALALMATAASAVVVEVGKEGQTFSEESIQVEEGDSIQFRFYNNHYVASGPFDRPCTAAPDGIFSGPQNVGPSGDGMEWVVPVTNASAPMWVYCGVGRHCQSGMVMVVNPPANGGPNGDRTIEAYKAAAARATTGRPPARPQGGEVQAVSEGDDASPTPTGGDSATPSSSEEAAATTTNAAASLSQNVFGTSAFVAVAGAFAWLL